MENYGCNLQDKRCSKIDRFHVVKLLNEAMNKVRIDERREHVALKNHKYAFLKNKAALSGSKRQALEEMITLCTPRWA